MPKRDLTAGLSSQTSQPMVQGKGYSLSTNNPEAEFEDTKLQVAEDIKTQVAKEPVIKRENAKLDPDLIQTYKLLAVQQKRKLYEVMEEALRSYLQSSK